MKAVGGINWVVCLFVIFLSIEAHAQSINDYRSVATGNWSSLSTWQQYNGSAWVAATDYPANTSAPFGPTYYVTLQSPFIVTLDITPRINQLSRLIVDFGATLVDTPTALSYDLGTTNGIVINGTVNLTNTTVLTSKISTNFTIVIGSTGVLSAHVVDANNTKNNFGTATITQDILGAAPWVNFGTLNFGGTSISGNFQANQLGNTVNYYSTSTNQTVRGGTSYWNLTLSGNGGRTKTLSANTTVSGNLSIQGNSSFSLGGFNLALGGSLNNSSTSTAALITSTGNFTFNGSTQQSIINTGNASGTNFNNLTIANNSSTVPQININVPSIVLVVSNSLTMTSGVINLNTGGLQIGRNYTNPVTVTHSGSSSSGWFYNGVVYKPLITNSAIAAGSNSGLFPVGTSTEFRPLYISTVTPSITPTLISLAAPGTSSFADVSITDGASTIRRQNRSGWLLSSFGSGTYNLRAGGTGLGVIGNVADLRLTPATLVLGSAGTNTGTTANPLVERTGLSLVDLNTTFYIGSVNLTSSPLPVELISFSGEAEGSVVNLNWVTRTELNCDYFTVYRSINGIDFVDVGTRKGAGTTKEISQYFLQDTSPLQGINYYRLEQTDWDGAKTFLSMISVDANGSAAMQVFPNPIEGGQSVDIKLHGLKSDSDQNVSIIDQLGQQVLTIIIRIDESGSFNGKLKLPQLSAGCYFVKINSNTKRLIIR